MCLKVSQIVQTLKMNGDSRRLSISSETKLKCLLTVTKYPLDDSTNSLGECFIKFCVLNKVSVFKRVQIKGSKTQLLTAGSCCDRTKKNCYRIFETRDDT